MAGAELGATSPPALSHGRADRASSNGRGHGLSGLGVGLDSLKRDQLFLFLKEEEEGFFF